ncbi:hypothetical protein F4680DRAFT_330289 [Xylaria scruposa]|nr:hypothetical protein F4680DRAFT_330289 [Xylaria scruposa]
MSWSEVNSSLERKRGYYLCYAVYLTQNTAMPSPFALITSGHFTPFFPILCPFATPLLPLLNAPRPPVFCVSPVRLFLLCVCVCVGDGLFLPQNLLYPRQQ